jgi:hypothetical protein
VARSLAGQTPGGRALCRLLVHLSLGQRKTSKEQFDVPVEDPAHDLGADLEIACS